MKRSLQNVSPFLSTAAMLSIIGQLLFYFIWTKVYPQAYENLPLRLIGVGLSLPLVFWRKWPESASRFLPLYFHLTVIYHLPFIFLYFLVMNEFALIWVLSSIGAAFILTFLIEWRAVTLIYIFGALIWKGISTMMPDYPMVAEFSSYVIVLLFPLSFGAIFSFQLSKYRSAQQTLQNRIRRISDENARMISEQNRLFSLFVSNSIVSRLRQFQSQFGLEKAISLITSQEERFCGIMEADIRNFTKLLGQESERNVAKIISRCFGDITSIGQDLSVIKPIGDALFIYTDDTSGKEVAVMNVLALAILFVQSLEDVNQFMVAEYGEPLNFGIAVHAGNAIYGNLASESLIDPTIIGLNVNLTARLEELTKEPVLLELIGPNAILLTAEAAYYCNKLVGNNTLVDLDLDDLGLSVRDFPQIRQIFALTHASAVNLYAQAKMHVNGQRELLSRKKADVQASSFHDVPYYFEMHGSGPDTSWTMLIDFGTISSRILEEYAYEQLSDLDFDIKEGESRWMILSTINSPGEYDEAIVEQRIHRIIRELQPRSISGKKPIEDQPTIARA